MVKDNHLKRGIATVAAVFPKVYVGVYTHPAADTQEFSMRWVVHRLISVGFFNCWIFFSFTDGKGFPLKIVRNKFF